MDRTKTLKLTKPTPGSTNWGAALNDNFDKIDKTISALQNALTTLHQISTGHNYINFYVDATSPNQQWDYIKFFNSDNTLTENYYHCDSQLNETYWTHIELAQMGVVEVGYVADSEFKPMGIIMPEAFSTNVQIKNNGVKIYFESLFDNTGFKLANSWTRPASGEYVAPYNQNWSAIDLLVKQTNQNLQYDFTKYPQSFGGIYTPQKEGNSIIFTLTPPGLAALTNKIEYNLSGIIKQDAITVQIPMIPNGEKGRFIGTIRVKRLVPVNATEEIMCMINGQKVKYAYDSNNAANESDQYTSDAITCIAALQKDLDLDFDSTAAPNVKFYIRNSYTVDGTTVYETIPVQVESQWKVVQEQSQSNAANVEDYILTDKYTINDREIINTYWELTVYANYYNTNQPIIANITINEDANPDN